MKKVRVLKEMPFAKVGEEFKYDLSGIWLERTDMQSRYLPKHFVEAWVEDGWLEIVEEENKLDNKLLDRMKKEGNVCGYLLNDLTEIAKEHYLRVFDHVYKNCIIEELSRYETCAYIRKAIEEA